MPILAEQPAHAAAIEALLDTAFGAHRTSKTVYRLRAGVLPLEELCFVALADDTNAVEGTIRYWPVCIAGATPALLLGPVAVADHRRNEGLGAELIEFSLTQAAALGHGIVLLVGDAPYYGRFGFCRSLAQGLSLPGPVDPERFLARELVKSALDGVHGLVGRGRDPAMTLISLDTLPPRNPG